MEREGVGRVLVAVKEIPVRTTGVAGPGNEREIQEKFDKIEKHLSDLVGLSHPNLVQHINIRRFIPNSPVDFPSCRIIMEFCTGISFSYCKTLEWHCITVY